MKYLILVMLLSSCTVMEGHYIKDGADIYVNYASSKTQVNPKFEVTKDDKGNITVDIGADNASSISSEDAGKIIGTVVNKIVRIE